jgi:hypothetical protein
MLDAFLRFYVKLGATLMRKEYHGPYIYVTANLKTKMHRLRLPFDHSAKK